MITSIEITKILIREKRDKMTQYNSLNGVYSSIGKKKLKGFDEGLMKLGGSLSIRQTN